MRVETTNFYSDIATNENENHNVTANAAGLVLNNIGGLGKSKSKVEFAKDTTVKGDIRSKSISINNA